MSPARTGFPGYRRGFLRVGGNTPWNDDGGLQYLGKPARRRRRAGRKTTEQGPN
ncbi:hypothetical protein [Arthrobacter sp. CAN_C5]|uniref:hypothetical protein n=1 Tax=Arthrobacter sp. CAN_C5 TaxID=2760706 RepID=UPI001AE9C7FD|nr:hypothetical protein [Arthrobacter sp. CAN_C5]MBP2215347.1 hypothetical protein [Arthrobacter sp. CAN_C5]